MTVNSTEFYCPELGLTEEEFRELAKYVVSIIYSYIFPNVTMIEGGEIIISANEYAAEKEKEEVQASCSGESFITVDDENVDGTPQLIKHGVKQESFCLQLINIYHQYSEYGFWEDRIKGAGNSRELTFTFANLESAEMFEKDAINFWREFNYLINFTTRLTVSVQYSRSFNGEIQRVNKNRL